MMASLVKGPHQTARLAWTIMPLLSILAVLSADAQEGEP